MLASGCRMPSAIVFETVHIRTRSFKFSRLLLGLHAKRGRSVHLSHPADPHARSAPRCQLEGGVLSRIAPAVLLPALALF